MKQKRTSGFYVIVTSMSELCRWLQKDDIEIMGMKPVKGVDGEDCVFIDYVHKYEEEES
jgi:hypothetical protein